MKIIAGYIDTRTNGEDVALTPYIHGVWVNYETHKIVGLGVCFIYYSFFLGLGFNLPKGYQRFRIYK